MSTETKHALRELDGMFMARHLAKCNQALFNPYECGTPEHAGFERIASLHCMANAAIHPHGAIVIARRTA